MGHAFSSGVILANKPEAIGQTDDPPPATTHGHAEHGSRQSAWVFSAAGSSEPLRPAAAIRAVDIATLK
jgi:hypothetical protein